MQNPKPLGYLAIERDGKQDRFSLLTASTRERALPAERAGWMEEAAG